MKDVCFRKQKMVHVRGGGEPIMIFDGGVIYQGFGSAMHFPIPQICSRRRIRKNEKPQRQQVLQNRMILP